MGTHACYVEQGSARYDAQVLQTKQRALKCLASRELGQQLVPIAQSARGSLSHPTAFNEISGLILWVHGEGWRHAQRRSQAAADLRVTANAGGCASV